MIVAVAGSRWNWIEPEEIAVLDWWLHRVGALYVRVGECRGIDTDARGCLLALGWRVQVWNAPWSKFSERARNPAGPIRNREMMRGRAVECEVDHLGPGWGDVDHLGGRVGAIVHWPGGAGTADARTAAKSVRAEIIGIEELVARFVGSDRGGAG